MQTEAQHNSTTHNTLVLTATASVSLSKDKQPNKQVISDSNGYVPWCKAEATAPSSCSVTAGAGYMCSAGNTINKLIMLMCLLI